MNLQESIRKVLREEKLHATPQELIKNLPKELKELLFKQWGAKQNPKWHPEGNTLKHIIVVIKRAYHHYPDDPNMVMAALFHDLGKIETYKINPKTNQPTAYGHEDKSTNYVEKFKDWIESFEGMDVEEIKYLVKNHMKVKPSTWDQMKDKKKEPIMSHPAFDKLMGFTDKLDGGGTDLKESIRRILREGLLNETKVPRSERVELYKDENIIVVVPLTHRALQKYANQCQWCINSDNSEWEDYHKGKHAVIIQRNPKKPKIGITGQPVPSEIFVLAKWGNNESSFEDVCHILEYEFRNDRTMSDYYVNITNDINNFATNIVYYSPETGIYDQENNFLWNFNYEINKIPNVTRQVIKIMDDYLQESEEMNLQETIKRISREELRLKEVVDIDDDSYITMNIKNFPKYKNEIKDLLKDRLINSNGDFVNFKKSVVVSQDKNGTPILSNDLNVDNRFLNYMVSMGSKRFNSLLYDIFSEHYGKGDDESKIKTETVSCDPSNFEIIGPITAKDSESLLSYWVTEAGAKVYRIKLPEECLKQLTTEEKRIYVTFEPRENRIHFPKGVPERLRGKKLGTLIYLRMIKKLGYITSSIGSSTEIKMVYQDLLSNPKYENDIMSLILQQELIIFDKNTTLNVKNIFNEFVKNKFTDKKSVSVSKSLEEILGDDYTNWYNGLEESSDETIKNKTEKYKDLIPQGGDTVLDTTTNKIYSFNGEYEDKGVKQISLMSDKYESLLLPSVEKERLKVIYRKFPVNTNIQETIKRILREEFLNESDPKTGTGKKPKGSDRRLYTDENPSDTVSVKFKTKEDIVDTLNKDSFKSKPHKRQSQIINLIHQRVRAAYQNASDPETKKRLKRGLDYIENEKEKSKEKTVRLQKQEQTESVELTERCWKGYTQKGMKTMFGKRYPNCVKKTKK